jgi:hypothetical protein
LTALARVATLRGGRLTATLRLIDSDKGIPFSTERPAGFVRFARFPEWRQGTAALGWEDGLGAAATLRAQLYGHRFDNTLAAYTDQDLDELSLESTFNDGVVAGGRSPTPRGAGTRCRPRSTSGRTATSASRRSPARRPSRPSATPSAPARSRLWIG